MRVCIFNSTSKQYTLSDCTRRVIANEPLNDYIDADYQYIAKINSPILFKGKVSIYPLSHLPSGKYKIRLNIINSEKKIPFRFIDSRKNKENNLAIASVTVKFSNGYEEVFDKQIINLEKFNWIFTKQNDDLSVYDIDSKNEGVEILSIILCIYTYDVDFTPSKAVELIDSNTKSLSYCNIENFYRNNGYSAYQQLDVLNFINGKRILRVISKLNKDSDNVKNKILLTPYGLEMLPDKIGFAKLVIGYEHDYEVSVDIEFPFIYQDKVVKMNILDDNRIYEVMENVSKIVSIKLVF